MNKITIIGLGPSALDQMPLGLYRAIKQAGKIYTRTNDHPAVDDLKAEGIEVESFDWVYEKFSDDFDPVYQTIADELIKLVEKESIIYTVPGHPKVAEKSVELLQNSEAKVEVLGGKSFIDDLFAAVNIDPVDGFQLLDSFDLNPDTIEAGQHIIVMQVFNSLIASDVKLSLMEIYPYDHPVYVIDAAGSSEQKVDKIPLMELDYFEGVYNLRSLYIPPLERDQRARQFNTLLSYSDEIISPEGDAWIIEQTPKSLVNYLKEETDELVEAIMEDDIDHIIEELGDVLMQVVYQAKLGELEGFYAMEDVLEVLNKKLRRRHPHVFDGVEAKTPEEVDRLWQEIKAQEKKEQDDEIR